MQVFFSHFPVLVFTFLHAFLLHYANVGDGLIELVMGLAYYLLAYYQAAKITF